MNPSWSISKKIGFVFLGIYFFLYANSSQFLLTFLIDPFWRIIVPWFANLLGHPEQITVFTNGSGDTYYNYYQIFLFFVLSIIISLIVVFLDRKRTNYEELLKWLTLLLRYYLALQMINYGLAKVFYLQFSFPSVARLDQELGTFSPMGLMWTFMGYSKGYTIFAGAMELVGGLLLLTRQTTTLGAMTTFGVMANVMMMNFCYDIPVKILSSHMVIMAIFLIALDGKRLLNFFITNQKIEPQILASIANTQQMKVKNRVKWTAIGLYLIFQLYQTTQMLKLYGPNADKPLFYGKYLVEDFKLFRNGRAADTIDLNNKWIALYQNWSGYASILKGDEKHELIKMEIDTTKSVLKLGERNSQDSVFQILDFEKLDPLTYLIYGNYNNDSISVKMIKQSINDYLLVNRGFHWVNEFPFNK